MSHPSFPHQITLKAIGFQWMIQFERTNPEGFIYGQMALQMETAHQNRSLGETRFTTSYRDLVRLIDYFDHHVASLVKDSGYHSDVFAPYELDFQVQALCGEAESFMDGEFTLRVMLAVDQTTDGTTVYAGVEAVVDVAQSSAFVTELRELLALWSSPQGNWHTNQPNEVIHTQA